MVQSYVDARETVTPEDWALLADLQLAIHKLAVALGKWLRLLPELLPVPGSAL